ncbi:MAG TPA: hypothetical protein VGH73_11935 [Thermoanaerobaculia bacterium]
MTETHETSEILSAMAAVRGKPEELAALLAIVKREGSPGPQGSTEEDRTALRKLLRERLRHLLAEAQRDIENILARVDRRPGPRSAGSADEAVALPSNGASSSGAYLATAATIRRGGAIAPAPPTSGERPEPEPDGQAAPLETAEIGKLTAQIVEIQRGLSAL